MFSSSPDLQEFLLIEAACRRLTLVYARGIDLYDDDMVLAAFARDGIWNRPGNPPLRGHPEIAEFLKSRDRAILMRHVMSNFQLELLGASRAKGVSYWTAFVAENHVPGTTAKPSAPFSVGEYEDEYMREDGDWKIARRTMRYIFRGSSTASSSAPR